MNNLFKTSWSGLLARPAFCRHFALQSWQTPSYLRFLILALLVSLTACGNRTEILGDRAHSFACTMQNKTEQSFDCQLAILAMRDRAIHVQETGTPAPLIWSLDLASVARQYSLRMCEQNFFSHADPNGQRIGDRLDQANITWFEAGENLAEGPDMTPEQAEQMFLAEPPCTEHRGILMDPRFQQIGVGAVRCDNRIIYTEILAQFDELTGPQPLTSCSIP